MSDIAERGFENFADFAPYRIAYKYDYLRVAEKSLKRQEADSGTIQRVLSDAYTVCESAHPLDDLFSCVSLRDERAGKNTSGKFRWRHQENNNIANELKRDHFHFNRDKLREGVSEYLKNPDLQDEWLDWYCADLLCFTELVSTIKETRIQVHGQLAHMLRGVGGSQSHLIQGAIFLAKWAVWILFLFYLFAQDGSINQAFAVFCVLGTVYVQYGKFSLWRKRSKIIDAMFRVYAVLHTPTFSWDVLWREMEDARKLGAIWDGEFWRLVEIRKDGAAKKDSSS
ncbi:MAG TPA: hypothetical protein PLO23_11320 [Alphaproteobacteria bacterium]|nr:hypothetical protein [Alphaproteobacteria bacterium]